MSKMGQLNQIIIESADNEAEFLELFNEINQHIRGRLRYALLSEAAKDILKLWEEDNESAIYNS